MGAGCSTSYTLCKDNDVKPASTYRSNLNSTQVSLVASRVLPFVPKRVVEAFCSGRLTEHGTGDTIATPEPRQLHAAFLLLDVSGFTKLSESFAEHGTEGIEKFSLLISSLFTRLTSVLEEHHGDIDCFAGDAFVAVFEGASGSTKPEGARGLQDNPKDDGVDLSPLVRRALACAKQLASETDSLDMGVQLRIHGAAAAGSVFAVECGESACRLICLPRQPAVLRRRHTEGGTLNLLLTKFLPLLFPSPSLSATRDPRAPHRPLPSLPSHPPSRFPSPSFLQNASFPILMICCHAFHLSHPSAASKTLAQSQKSSWNRSTSSIRRNRGLLVFPFPLHLFV
mmetsp:Transcript_35054/g.83156  ORF Transcript_35054/g.83156 Transcript_35054/m.83156 type:complete len:340 (+) Transcript_35054:86-1105(+)